MTEVGDIKEWMNATPFVWSIIKFLVILVVIVLGIRLIRTYLKRKFLIQPTI